MRRIIYTRPDGGVNVYGPAKRVIHAMTHGGKLRAPRGTIDDEIAKQCAGFGLTEDVAARYVRGIILGGLTEPEAYAIMRDRDCRGGTGHDLIDVVDLPGRWFRDAWRRSHNGGPIIVDMGLARRIQRRRIAAALREETEQRQNNLDAPPAVDMPRVLAAIARASSPDALESVWPDEIPRPVPRMPRQVLSSTTRPQ